jgi:hypothetical protein
MRLSRKSRTSAEASPARTGLHFLSHAKEAQRMNRIAIDGLRDALAAARAAAHTVQLDSCDVDDLEAVIEPATAELAADLPNVATLGTYLNSLARSLRSEPAARAAVMQLDAAMRNAGIPTQWEH